MTERPAPTTARRLPEAERIDAPPNPTRPRRAPWRQRMVEAERGFVEGFRGDSAFFVYFFAGAIVVAAGLVLGLGFFEWLFVALSLTLVVIAELFHQMAKAVFEAFPSAPVGLMRKTLRLGMAAVFASIGGSALVVGALFLRRIMELLGER